MAIVQVGNHIWLYTDSTAPLLVKRKKSDIKTTENVNTGLEIKMNHKWLMMS